jgi:hypothetical protein
MGRTNRHGNGITELFRLWLTGLTAPARAFKAVGDLKSPLWGFLVVLIFNLAISATTLLAQYLLGRPPLMESWLTFLPAKNYLFAEMFFLPPLRVLVWLMGAAVIHLGLRLAGSRSDMDKLLNIGGLGYLVLMPFILVTDWILIGLDSYRFATWTHPLAALWGAVLSVIGLRTLLGTKTWLAVTLTVLSSAAGIAFLAVFAR